MLGHWSNETIEWRKPKIWTKKLTRWLKPYLIGDFSQFNELKRQDICHDDPRWLDILENVLHTPIDKISEQLGKSLACASVRAFHGCRTDNVSNYFREGILCNNPRNLETKLRTFLYSNRQLSKYTESIDIFLKNNPDFYKRDAGNVFVVMDDEGLLKFGGHYCIYGSEWITSMLDKPAREILRTIGLPTIIILNLPLNAITEHERNQLATQLMQEWTRIEIKGHEYVPAIDFSFCLRQNIPPAWLVGHYHPSKIFDQIDDQVYRFSQTTICPHCRA